MKTILLSTALLITGLGMQLHAQSDDRILAGKSNRPMKLKVSADEAESFFAKYYLVNETRPDFSSIHLFQAADDHWYLLGKTESSRYAFALLPKGKKLYLNRKQILHQCPAEPGQEASEIFILTEDGIIGCQTGNHRISITQ